MTTSDFFAAQNAIALSFERHFRNYDEKKKGGLEKPSFLMGFLKVLIYFVGFLGPVLVLREFFVLKTVQNVSSLWVVFLLFSPFWIVYGFLCKSKPIIFTYSLWFLVGIVLFFSS